MTQANFLDALDRLRLLAERYEVEARRELGSACCRLNAAVSISSRGEIELVADYALADHVCRQIHFRIGAAQEVALADAFGRLRSEIGTRRAAC